MPEEKKGGKTPSGPSVLKRNWNVGGWWPAQVVKSITGMILDDPEGPLDFLWRIFSITSVTSILVFGLLIWKNPTLDGLFEHRDESIAIAIEKDKALGEEMMELMGDFFSFYKPAHLALIDWTKGTGVELVWSNIPGANFPTPVSGIIGLNMKPAVAEMVYGECWMGKLGKPVPGVPEPFWIACPITGPHGVQGFVLMSWNVPPCNTKTAATKLLAHRIGALVF
ncbi:predicted protein [Cyanophage PSS2]|uniref:hypothetical protein n=1 Tax=Cyanophage PSS2 TaxID=658401 RepID=UPI0001B04038|nr:hypothetical protein PSS2_gp097 [Cyanophage PSS2]ACT65659.1 hypothetical protein [Cyanophage PSS2]ACY75800.1 predicted protein [Cyanophage PSS2]